MTTTTRPFTNIPPLNRHQNDYKTEVGTRVCLPCYIDPTTTVRKELLNAVRTLASQPVEAEQQPSSMSGISVASYSTQQPAIEAYLGMSVDNLRASLFMRGGLEVSLVLKLQAITGITVVSDKDFTAAFKEKQALVKGFSKEYPFNA